MGLKEIFEARGFLFREFDTKKDAVDYLCNACHGKTVSFGGSVTLQEMELYDALNRNSTCLWHWKSDSTQEIAASEVFITSANAVSRKGEIVNIDGNCNRISSAVYGHQQVFVVFGENKLTSDLVSAYERARNVAAPMNAKRLNRNTPCVFDGKCHDCQSPECICSTVSIMRRKPSSCTVELILIHENLGY